jgi:hypothetical protein
VLRNFGTRHRFELFCFWFQNSAFVNSRIAILKKSNDVIPNASQIFRSVGTVGTMFFLYHEEMVVDLIPA